MIALLKKDFLLFTRDRKNVFLVILTPVIIMITLGNVFSGTTKEEFLKNIKLGYCSEDREFQFVYPFALLTYPENCKEKTKEAVRNGKMRGAILIPKTFTSNIKEGYGSELFITVDNAKPQTAFAITTAIEAMVNAMNEQIGVSFIQEAWNNLKDLDKKLIFAAEHLETAKQAAFLLQGSTTNFSKHAEIINISTAYALVDHAQREVNSTLQNMNFTNLPPINITTYPLLQEYNNAMMQGNDQLAVLIQNISSLEKITERIREEIEEIDNAQQNVKVQLDKISALTASYATEVSILQANINQTAHFLAIYTKRDPKNIVRAVAVKTEETFPETRPFPVMAPGIIIIVLMLITFLTASTTLVTERKSGTMMRNILSPVPLHMFLLEKIIFLLLLCAIQIVLMLIVVAFFDVFFTFSVQVFGIFLLASLFLVTGGLLLGAIARSENTALLSSLVISIPLMFLSGVFFAFESMPKEMAFLGANSPITLIISLLESIHLYHTLPYYPFIEIILGTILVFFVFIYLIIKKNAAIE